ncbi:MAG: endolytic transglycosylase MltG [Clostridia bacterium]|nr:endolytic transglycosylase MltG [Clostridia bacterium]
MRNKEKQYTHQSVRDERLYGFYWYSGLWMIVRPILVMGCAIVIVVGVLLSAANYANNRFFSAVDPTDKAMRSFTVEAGSSLTRVSNNLEEKDFIHNRSLFKYYCDFLGFSQKIQSGEYMLSRSMSMTEIIDQLTRGDGKPITHPITVIPGWTIEDIAEKFYQDKIIPDKQAFLDLCRSGDTYRDYYYIDEILRTPNVGRRKYVLEGYLSPNTYEIYTGSSADAIIRKLLSQTEAVLPMDYHERAAELGMTIDKIMTLASLIEKEAKTADFAKVSAIFHNRLALKMRLGSDVTIHYITGIRKMALSNSDLQINSLYNTYQNTGLPLGPICSPSQNAITAALYPDETFIAEKYLYFCSKDPQTGELHFSKTQKEHDAAVATYAPLWKAYDENRGL